MSHAASVPAAGQRNETVIVFALSLAAMVVSMMQTLPVPILGLIQGDLGTSTANVSWVTTATLLSAAVFTPLLGRFGDQHGKKPTLVAVLVVMVAGSVVAALASSLPLLILGRVLQGAATAIFPLALSVLREEVRPQKLPGAMALVSGTLAFGSGLALVATGLLTSGADADYRNAFWMATGFAALALLAVVFLVPATRHKTGGRTDFLGALTLGIALLLLLLPISQGHEWGWTSGRTLGTFAGAAVMTVVWVLTELKVREPLVDMRMFIHRPVLMANLAGILVGFGMFANFLGVSYFVQMPEALTGFGFDASILRASVQFLLPGAIVSLLASPIGGQLVRQRGPRFVLGMAAVFGAVGFGWLALDHAHTASVIGAGLMTGAAVSFGYAAMPAVIMASVPHHQSGIANGINSISRSTGSAIGSAIVTTILASKTIEHLPAGVPPLPAESGFTLTFGIGAVAFALVAVISWLGLRGQHGPRVVEAGRASADAPSTPAVETAVADPVTEPAVQADAVQAGAGFRGLVRDADGEVLGGAALALVSPDGRQVGRTVSQPDGRYALDAPTSGPYVLITAAEGHQPQAATVMAAATPVAYAIKLPRVTGPAGLQVRGTVRAGEGGRRLPDARVTLVDAAGNVVRTTITDADGAYAFTDLTAGEYSLIASGYPPVASTLAVEGRGTDSFDMALAHPAAQ
ncbi:MFS transporter [Streptomyces sp. NBC_01794]|uniref:MFS transporter n=1 Tax=Streptomyces sp. NBC_01794 TaxID=2975942 RepID=UPI003872E0CF